MLGYLIIILISGVYAVIFYHNTNPEIVIKQKILITALRALILCLLLMFLLSPTIYYIKKYIERPEVILLMDNSTSMQIMHQGIKKNARLSSTYNNIRTAFKKAGYSIKDLEFADGLNGKRNKTFIVPTLEEIIKLRGKKPIKNIVLFSDGWYRDSDLRIFKSFDIPIYTISDTIQLHINDLEVIDCTHNKQGYKNELSLFEASIKSNGYKGNAVTRFLVDDKVVKEKTVSFQLEPIQKVAFDYRFTRLGLHKVEVQVSAKGLTETTLTNNNYSSAIDILNDKERILLVTDVPNWDTKFILDAIRENNRIEALSLTIRGNELYQGEQKTTIKSWDNITAIIVVNQGALQIPDPFAKKVINHVKQGCGLLYFGLPVSQLYEILPLKSSNIQSSYKGSFKLLPPSGLYSVFNIENEDMNQIPPVDYYYLVPSVQSEVLAVMDNVPKSPAIGLSNINIGKVVSFSFINLWRWQMQSKSLAYRSFFIDLITWLSNKTSGQLTAFFEPSYYLDEQIEIKLTAIDEIRKTRTNLAPRLVVMNSQKDSVFNDFMVQDGDEYKIKFRLDQSGEYSLKISDQNSNQSVYGKFIVLSQNLEERDLDYNNPLLKWIAEQTGGKYLEIEEADKLKPITSIESERLEKKEFPLYKKWYLVSLFILLFCTELYLRRRWGLL